MDTRAYEIFRSRISLDTHCVRGKLYGVRILEYTLSDWFQKDISHPFPRGLLSFIDIHNRMLILCCNNVLKSKDEKVVRCISKHLLTIENSKSDVESLHYWIMFIGVAIMWAFLHAMNELFSFHILPGNPPSYLVSRHGHMPPSVEEASVSAVTSQAILPC